MNKNIAAFYRLIQASQNYVTGLSRYAGDFMLPYLISTPITSKEEVIGVLRLYSGVKREFPEDVITLVKALAHQGGLAIQNASMYLKLQDDKESLEKDIWSHRARF